MVMHKLGVSFVFDILMQRDCTTLVVTILAEFLIQRHVVSLTKKATYLLYHESKNARN